MPLAGSGRVKVAVSHLRKPEGPQEILDGDLVCFHCTPSQTQNTCINLHLKICACTHKFKIKKNLRMSQGYTKTNFGSYLKNPNLLTNLQEVSFSLSTSPPQCPGATISPSWLIRNTSKHSDILRFGKVCDTMLKLTRPKKPLWVHKKEKNLLHALL